MNKYLVTGKMVVHFPFEMEVEADSPVEAEQIAVKQQRFILRDVHDLETNERPIEVSVHWVPDKENDDE